ncbi:MULTISPECIES: DUF389 domain-containing protein [unclassified Synechococcus]|uniref:DUF389 domain-containing protein n=1 Tax=unclassified Synechococcus TaxID=2626047 RepID=UPI001E5D4636|nr:MULTISPECIES: DUF389 domain-containing protein [unclassified Synechococcus]WFN57748.1 DUF389 domain-containing protein [Synechococcus sp. CCFWC 502]
MIPNNSEELLPRDIEVNFGAWGVRNYHTTLEQRAIAGATITGGYISMVVAATVMATAGLLLNSAAVVIGSMCVAPFMAPSRAVCIGALFRNGRILVGGFVKQFFGLLAIGACLSAVITFVLRMYIPDIDTTPEILLRAMPSGKEVVLNVLIAVSAGAAASLALVAHPKIAEHPWGQAIDAVIGVQVAISLIPPAAVIGIGWVVGKPEQSWNAFCLLVLNVVALDLVGSISVLAISGVRRRHLELEKSIRAIAAGILKGVPHFVAIGSSVDVTLLGERDAIVDIRLRCQNRGFALDTLAHEIGAEVMNKASCQADVAIEIVSTITCIGIRHSAAAGKHKMSKL